jgi:acetoin utilization deacetylase AcuC-like enzyme
VSAGYDGHMDDPLAHMQLQDSDYGRMAYRLGQVAAGRVVLFLEGGYSMEGMSASVAATLRGLAGEFPDLESETSPARAFHMLEVAAAQVGRFWDTL